jgi:hypothetical protein
MPPKQHANQANDANFADCEEAEFIDELIADPRSVPDVVVLTGHLGESARGAAWWRLYLSLNFKSYVEFLEADIRRAQEAIPGQPLAGTIVWLASDARIWHVGVQTRYFDVTEYLQAQQQPPTRPGGSMLEGPITQDGLIPGTQVGIGWSPLITLGCPPSWWRC